MTLKVTEGYWTCCYSTYYISFPIYHCL